MYICEDLIRFVLTVGGKIYAVICHVSDALLDSKAKLNELDNQTGDGDCGSTFSSGATGVQIYCNQRIMFFYSLTYTVGCSRHRS